MQKLLSTRGGTIALGGAAAVLAAIVLVVYLNRYRDSVNENEASVAVLVARNLIPRGTPGDVVGSDKLFETQQLAQSQVKNGAVTDPSILRGRTAVQDIYPNQQLTTADFSTTATPALGLKLSGEKRAISIPIDPAHGMIGKIQAGDHVDVLGGFSVKVVDRLGRPVEGGNARPIIKAILQDILVIAVPGTPENAVSEGAVGGNLTLEVTPEQAAQLAFASDNGTLWFVLRPRSGAPPVSADIVTLETLVLGIKPIAIEKSFVQGSAGAQP